MFDRNYYATHPDMMECVSNDELRDRYLIPDLFREGSGAVAEGRMQGGTFIADTILAKHDERYMPPELGNLSAEHKAGKTLER